MPRSDRLMRLMDCLRRTGPHRGADLAEELEISLRSLYRDIATLRAGGANIEGEAGYGYILRHDRALPPMQFAQDELAALSLGLDLVKETADVAMAEAAERARTRIAAVLPDDLRPYLDHSPTKAKFFQNRQIPRVCPSYLRQMAQDERVLHLIYEDANGDISRRNIWPLAVITMDRGDYLATWCCLRDDFRAFRLDRMIETTQTGQSFRPHRVAYWREFQQHVKHD